MLQRTNSAHSKWSLTQCRAIGLQGFLHRAALLHGLGQIADLRGSGARQIGDDSRYFQCTLGAARRPAQARCCHTEEFGGCLVKLPMQINFLALQCQVGFAVNRKAADLVNDMLPGMSKWPVRVLSTSTSQTLRKYGLRRRCQQKHISTGADEVVRIGQRGGLGARNVWQCR